MANFDIAKLKLIFAALDNEKRIKIIELCSEKAYSVIELSKKVSLNYSVTVEYVSMLANANLVSKVRNEDKTVSIKSLVKINNSGEIERID